MRVRTIQWAAGCVATASVALLAGALALSYVHRRLPASGWDFSNVFEDLTFMAVPVVGFVLVARRPANRVGRIFLAAGLVLGLGSFPGGTVPQELSRVPALCLGPGRPPGS